MLRGKNLRKINDLNKKEAEIVVAEANLKIRKKREELDKILLKAYKEKLNGKS